MGGGAWPFLVCGAICLVNFVNERDLSLLTSYVEIIAIVGLQLGIPSKRESSARVDYVPALCTHRLSLLPIEWSGDVFGLQQHGRFVTGDIGWLEVFGTSVSLLSGGATPSVVSSWPKNKTRAPNAPRKLISFSSPRRPGDGKCDTWCEFQNPMNHRFFERKLRLKPLGRGHACMCVAHRCHHALATCQAPSGANVGFPGAMSRGWLKTESTVEAAVMDGGYAKARNRSGAKPEETLVEARSDTDVQIVRLTWIYGRKTNQTV
ncbi:unnamed protein product [Lupinus luteus]|uniref:Uncharacterized protein n=1 Tax=Lupinus luteus TaxID=3873 RepID=A0AAV1VZ79_LUPLU